VNGQPGLAQLFRWQAPYCEKLGSPLYADLLERAADDIEGGGPVGSVLEGHEQDPPGSMPQLRFLGAVHRLALAGEAPELEPWLPSLGGQADPAGAWQALQELLSRIPERVRAELPSPVQTNEVGRSAALLGGFLLVAARTGLPLRVLEAGSSAGLILHFDRYFYVSGARSWGDAAAPVHFQGFIEGDSFPWHVQVSVADRRGCDASPLDPASADDAIRLRSFVWPDMLWRFELLSAALELARVDPVAVERADAAEWAEQVLGEERPGAATVLFHSLVLHSLDDATRERFVAVIEDAGRRATEQAPFAWLRMEIGGDEADVRLTTWPGGEEELIARAGYHGRPVRWLAA
jgi:hypothetical protein